MAHEYIAETTHGDKVFTTDVHHTHHHRGLLGWYEDHKDFINSIIALLGQGVQLLGIHESRQGRRTGQILRNN
ncbi:hypothetical protein ACGFYZ_10280 [Streptomyces sp. NPDC048330]|uniref:hypothetical protein n=1 Tax=Streptomyces sp. NPDC048330 TaxID=3365533 RepID=UPI003718D5FF